MSGPSQRMRARLAPRATSLRVAESMAATDSAADCIELDLGDQDSIGRFVRGLRSTRTSLDILVNCAGSYSRAGWRESSPDELERMLDVNVRGVFALTAGLLPLLVCARGDIVFVNSSIVRADGRAAGLYAASKHALKGLADSLRGELNEKGVRVLSVYPGRTATPMQARIHAAENLAYDPGRLLQPEDVAEAVAACLELGDTAEVTELDIRPRYRR